MYTGQRLLTLLLYGILICACSRAPINVQRPQALVVCDEVLPKPLKSLFSTDHSVQSLSDLISVGFPQVAPDVSPDSHMPNAVWIDWAPPGRYYSAGFYQDQLIRVDVSIEDANHTPTLSDILRCFGTPSHYSATFKPGMHGPEFLLHFWYPEQGYIFSFYEFPPADDPPPITEDIPLGLLTLVRPGSVEQLVRQVYDTYSEHLDEIVAMRVGQVQAWPGDWRNIVVIDTLPP